MRPPDLAVMWQTDVNPYAVPRQSFENNFQRAFAVFARVWLRGLAPSAIEQMRAGCDARRLALATLGDAREDLDGALGVRTR